MKLQITLKDPDGVSESIRRAAMDSVCDVNGLDESEHDALIDGRVELLCEDVKPWVRYGEYVTVEIDTDNGTAIVCKTNR